MIRQLMPKTFFVRALLIVVLPTVLLQLVTAYAFYERHWESVTRRMADTLVGEITFLSYQGARLKLSELEALTWIFEESTGVRSEFQPGARLETQRADDFPELREKLAKRLDLPFTVVRREAEEEVEVRVQLAGGVLAFHTTLKRLESGTTEIFMLWMIGSALVFLCIALLFLRNQVRPIRQLAEAAESFGKGGDVPNFKPHGALEVRRAARAFLVMRDRIVRQIRSRTEMLAGISHDLRTPLTRMKLQLALQGDGPETRELQADVAQMERMITEYLDFARGEGGEESVRMRISTLLAKIAEDYRRQDVEVPLEIAQDAELDLRENAFCRMMHNLIDNALRYGTACRMSTHVAGAWLEIRVDDRGPGIPEAQREEVFRPFARLEESRNPESGGVGLGLSIARDVARAHGGNILLADAPGGGLRATVRVPL